ALEHHLQAPEALQQLGRRLVADPRDARDVVRGVALESVEVGDELGRDAVALDHRFAVIDLGLGDAAARGHHAYAVLDQLEAVAVAGNDHHLDALRARLPRERGDHVVRLVAGDLDVAVAEGLHQRLHLRPLLRQEVGSLLGTRAEPGGRANGYATFAASWRRLLQRRSTTWPSGWPPATPSPRSSATTSGCTRSSAPATLRSSAPTPGSGRSRSSTPRGRASPVCSGAWCSRSPTSTRPSRPCRTTCRVNATPTTSSPSRAPRGWVWGSSAGSRPRSSTT